MYNPDQAEIVTNVILLDLLMSACIYEYQHRKVYIHTSVEGALVREHAQSSCFVVFSLLLKFPHKMNILACNFLYVER